MNKPVKRKVDEVSMSISMCAQATAVHRQEGECCNLNLKRLTLLVVSSQRLQILRTVKKSSKR